MHSILQGDVLGLEKGDMDQDQLRFTVVQRATPVDLPLPLPQHQPQTSVHAFGANTYLQRSVSGMHIFT